MDYLLGLVAVLVVGAALIWWVFDH